MRRFGLVAVCLGTAVGAALAAAAPAARAQSTPAAPADADQAAAHRRRLEHWKQLSPEARTQLLERYRRFQAMPPAERDRVKQNLRRWRELDPAELQKLRKAQERWRRLEPAAREALQARVARFRELPADKQLDYMEKAEAVFALPEAERTQLAQLPEAEQRQALRQVVQRHRLAHLMQKLTPEERAAVAAVPEAEQRHALHRVMAARREAQMTRLPQGVREAIAELPPGSEREQSFRRALEGVNRFEREAAGLLSSAEREQLRALSPEERSARFRAMAPTLVARAIDRLPERERTRLVALPVAQQLAALRELRQQRLVERSRQLLRREQWRFVQQLPREQRLDWTRELIEANREAYLDTLDPAARAAFEELRPAQREQRLRAWLGHGTDADRADRERDHGRPR